MKIEIDSATKFLVELMKKSPKGNIRLSDDKLQQFRQSVVDCLTQHYADHWHPEHPVKGSGYRCIRINGKVDPILIKAGHLMGLAAQFLHGLLPSDLTMWVDPHEVSYRIGENGSICVLYEDETMRTLLPPTPPSTPPNKKIRSSPEPPATPIKLQNTHLSHQQQVTPPSHNMSLQFFSPSNRRSSPINYQFLTQHHLTPLFENNCKDIMRTNMFSGPEGLFVSS